MDIMIVTMMLTFLDKGNSLEEKFRRCLRYAIEVLNSNMALLRWISPYHLIWQWLDEYHQIKHWFIHKLLQKYDGTRAGAKDQAWY